jgi:hypothetical protein
VRDGADRLTAMGIMIALLALLWRQVGSVAQVLGVLFEMLGSLPADQRLSWSHPVPGVPLTLYLGL